MTTTAQDYSITKAGRNWIVTEIATGEIQVYLKTRREAERWVTRWVAAAAEEAEYQAERRAARISRIRGWQAERAERTDAQLTLI